jgi:hypothetical protein
MAGATGTQGQQLMSISNFSATVGELQRGYLFKVYLEELPDIDSILEELGSKLNKEKAISDIDIFVKTGFFPSLSTETYELRWSGEKILIPTVQADELSYETQIYLGESMYIKDVFVALKCLTGNPWNHGGVPTAAQTFTMGIATLSIDKETITDYYQLRGCAVTSVGGIELSKEGTEPAFMTVTLSYQKAIPIPSFRGKAA